MTTTRRRLAATASLLLVPTLAACGFGVQTNQQYQSAAGTDSLQVKTVNNVPVDNSKSPVQVYNAAIVVPHVGSTHGLFVGTFVNVTAPNPAQGYTSSGDLVSPGVTATVVSMSVNNVPASESLNKTLAPNTSYAPQPTGADKAPEVPVPATVTDGGYVTMTFTIAVAGSGTQTVTMNVPVFPADSQSFYAQYYPKGGDATAQSPSSSEPTSTSTAH